MVWILKGVPYKRLGTGRVALLRGKGLGLELVFAGRELEDAFEELEARLAERPGFYRGTSATINFGNSAPSSDAVTKLQSLLNAAGIELRALAGGAGVEELARASGLGFEAAAGEAPELERRRALRPRAQIRLSDSARSLVADFAGARADIAQRRKRGEASVPQLELPPAEVPPDRPRPASLHVVEATPGTLYHAGTLRGGQTLHHAGNVVVVGDVNPGAEIVGTGDVVVFGRLAGVAHAGAQGDPNARVYAIALDPTQLRIATFIAADAVPAGRRGPEVALVRDDRIVVVAFDRLDHLSERGLQERES